MSVDEGLLRRVTVTLGAAAIAKRLAHTFNQLEPIERTLPGRQRRAVWKLLAFVL